MGTYVPMEDRQRNDNATTMMYLRNPLSNSQSQPLLLPGGLVHMNLSSASAGTLALSDAYSDSVAPQQVLLSFGGERGMDGHLMVGEDSNIIHSLQGQGLSLSLATNVMQMAPVQYPGGASEFLAILGDCRQPREDDYVMSSGVGSSSDAMHEVLPACGMARGVPSSKYLKAAQELLDEVVNVQQAVKERNVMKDAAAIDGKGEPRDEAADPLKGDPVSELLVAEKHDLQNKLTNLLSMLDEVDRRYRQYYHQMQIVMSSFDVVGGDGASRPYTALALKTISRHYRCLRDAINNQIQGARRSLGEDDASLNKGVGISRLRYIDQQLRQQRALQQLGMIEQHTWRPQRGLPESSVSILRAWLFEHFLHPYPQDSDKIMLAKQTGLTRSQVSNWFINARVRLWKPMVEEMYKEEAGDTDMDSNSSSKTRAAETPPKASKHLQQSEASPGSRPDLMGEMMGSETIPYNMISQNSNSAGRGSSKAFPDGTESCSGNRRFLAAYHISELERFGNAGGVSLTLGLQQEGSGVDMAEASQDGFAPMRDTDMYNAAAASGMGAETAEFVCIDSGSQPHQFTSSLLPSFL